MERIGDLIVGLERSLTKWKAMKVSTNIGRKQQAIKEIENILGVYRANRDLTPSQIQLAKQLIENSNKRDGVKNEQNYY
jgi:hypothetical protein